MIGGTFTEWLKYSKVKPLYKESEKFCISNYRPVLLLTASYTLGCKGTMEDK
jgi:hypothetical protein